MGLPCTSRDGRGRRGSGTAAHGSVARRDEPTTTSGVWAGMACLASWAVWDLDGYRAVSARQVRLARNAGALDELQRT